MNTTAAALEANVTVATIRTWCRYGAVAAIKQAGRWAIDTASLAHRIAIGQLKRKATMSLDLNATYTHTYVGATEPTVITPIVKTRTRGGATITTVRGLAPLLADRINAIADEGQRLHALEALSGAVIAISDQAEETMAEGADGLTAWHDYGRLTTSFQGTSQLTTGHVLDLAAAIRASLA